MVWQVSLFFSYWEFPLVWGGGVNVMRMSSPLIRTKLTLNQIRRAAIKTPMLCKKSPTTWMNAARTLTFSSSSTIIKLDGEAWCFLLEDFFLELKPWLWPCPFWCRIIPNLLTRRWKLKKLSTFIPCLSINLLAFYHEWCSRLIGWAFHYLFCCT